MSDDVANPAALTPPAAEIPPDTRLGPVHLTVADLDRSVDYYQRVVGLAVRERGVVQDRRPVDEGARFAALGARGTDLVVLIEHPGAPPARGYAGLYHLALVVPARADLAGWLAHAVRTRVALTGLSDHFVSEAIYLSDPDEHGIELYWDRPRPHWEGQVAQRMTSFPLDTNGLLAELDDPATAPFDGLPPGTSMGHVHLRVADVPSTVAFYRDVLGFRLMATFGRQAAFLAAGGYHHHIGANSWESAGAPQAPPGTATLRHATIVLPDTASRDAVVARVARSGQAAEDAPAGFLVRDPSGNALVLAVAVATATEG